MIVKAFHYKLVQYKNNKLMMLKTFKLRKLLINKI